MKAAVEKSMNEKPLKVAEQQEGQEGEPRERLSSLIHRIFDPARGETSIGTLMKELDQHGIALVLIVFSFPSALPVPAPGYSTLLSMPLLFIGIGLLLGKKAIEFPKFVSSKTFNPAKFTKAIKLMTRIAVFLERFSKPRFTALVRSYSSRMLVGGIICLLGLSMAVPIPGTNTLPAGGIFLIGFSFLEDDSLFLLLGIMWSAVALCFTLLVIFLGYEGAKLLVKGIIGLTEGAGTETTSALFEQFSFLIS